MQFRFPQTNNSITDLLTARQHTHPHLSVRDVLEQAISQLGCCPVAIDRAIDRLHFDATRAVGRLRRSELLQLARSIERFWKESAEPVQDRS